MKKFWLALLCILLCGNMVYADTMLKNAAFDSEKNWELSYYFKDRESSISIVQEDGQNVVQMTSELQNHVTAKQTVKVTKGKLYKITAETKTIDVSAKGRGACIGIYNHLIYSSSINGTSNGYKTVELYVRPQVTELPVMLSLGGHGEESSGTAYFRNPRMVEIEEKDVPADATIQEIRDTNTQSNNQNGDKSYLPTTELDAKWYMLITLLALAVLGTFYYIWFRKK